MALDKVIQAILDDGKKETDRILSEGRQEAKRIIDEAKKEADIIKIKKSEEANAFASRMKTQETARADIDSKKLVLKVQKEILDEIFDLALEQLGEKWSGRLIETTLKQKSSEIKDALVYSNERDRQITERVVKTYGGKFGGTIDCVGGLIIENKDGTVRIDYRLETMLKDVWDDSVIEVTSLLWGERKDG